MLPQLLVTRRNSTRSKIEASITENLCSCSRLKVTVSGGPLDRGTDLNLKPMPSASGIGTPEELNVISHDESLVGAFHGQFLLVGILKKLCTSRSDVYITHLVTHAMALKPLLRDYGGPVMRF